MNFEEPRQLSRLLFYINLTIHQYIDPAPFVSLAAKGAGLTSYFF
jgi:hypothetical protein